MQRPDEPHALNAFLAGVEHRALRMADFATRNREDALDIVQDTMFRLCENYSHRPQEEWAPLFFRILERRILDWHRRKRVRRKLFGWARPPGRHDEAQGDDSAGNTGGTHAPSAEEVVMADHALERIGTVLESLPLRQQQVFLLRVWQGLDVRHTAAAMGCSEGSVKTHLSRAIARLREVLGDDEA